MSGLNKASRKQKKETMKEDYSGRWRLTVGLFFCAMTALVGRAVFLQVMDGAFLQQQGRARHVSKVTMPAYRGNIVDRNGELLAVSTPVKSVYADPAVFLAEPDSFYATTGQLAQVLDMPVAKLRKRIQNNSGKRFIYLKRRIIPELAQKVEALNIAGIALQREYRRYYPTGEVTAHVLGFTDIDDIGQEGLELAYQDWLQGIPGSKRVIRNGKRQGIEPVDQLRATVPGNDLVLSIDQRVQYMAYRELKKAVLEHKAQSGSLVILKAKTGEVLAMVNQPSFNPNKRSGHGGKRRNRAITDVFEPGSTMKPFAVACAMEQGYSPRTVIDTRPGYYRVGRNVVRDTHNYGVIDVPKVLQKSSNVGVSKIALSMQPEQLWGCYDRLGFGRLVSTGFPGESSGALPGFQGWRQFQQATLSFGYGLSASTMQLARAYLAIANDGLMPPVTLLKPQGDEVAERVFSAEVASQVRYMLEAVVSREGTAIRAAIPGFRVAGKTGTVKKVGAGGYMKDRYLALFAGMAPASDPELVMVVIVNDPATETYYGGTVAAPVFSRVMDSALRLLGISPDLEVTEPIMASGFGDKT